MYTAFYLMYHLSLRLVVVIIIFYEYLSSFSYISLVIDTILFKLGLFLNINFRYTLFTTLCWKVSPNNETI